MIAHAGNIAHEGMVRVQTVLWSCAAPSRFGANPPLVKATPLQLNVDLSEAIIQKCNTASALAPPHARGSCHIQHQQLRLDQLAASDRLTADESTSKNDAILDQRNS